MNYLDKIKKTLLEEINIKRGDRILVALSGGADSMLLITLLLKLKDELGFDLSCFHLDHMYRGKESYEDYCFVKEFAREHAIDVFAFRRDINTISKRSQCGFEMMARKKRSSLLEAVRVSERIDYIATAHHADDNAESIFMHFIRGSSLRGLSGMPVKRGCYIRPLISFSKEDILDAIDREEVAYRDDYTNSQSVYSRNRVRNKVFPEIKKINDGFSANIIRLSNFVKKDDDFIEAYISEHKARFFDCYKDRIDIRLSEISLFERGLLGRLIMRQFLYLTGSREDVYSTMIAEIEELCEKGKNGRRKIFKNIAFEIRDGFLIAENISNTSPSKVKLKLGHNIFGGRIFFVRYAKAEDRSLFYDKNTLVLHEDVLEQGVMIRNRESGDYIYQKNLPGKKKIKKLFNELKLSQHQREKMPLLCLSNEVYWVIGVRKSVHHYKSVDQINRSDEELKYNCKQFIIITVEPLL